MFASARNNLLPKGIMLCMDFIRRARAVLNLGNPLIVAALLTTLSVMGCGGGDGGGDDTPVQAPYVGNWYQASADVYLEIQTGNTAVLRTCSANGYKAVGTGTIQGDSLTLSSTTVKLTRDGDTLTILTPDDFKVEFALANAIPTVCPNDFIEITSVNPATGTANVPTSFTVSFDYQLATKDNGIIYLGFNTSGPHTYSLINRLTVIRGAGSGSLTASASPAAYPSPDSFGAYVNLSEDPHPVPWSPLKSDVEPIVVMQGNGVSPGIIMNKATNKRQGMSISGWSCGNGAIGSCAMLLP
jgi:hypothetical protein